MRNKTIRNHRLFSDFSAVSIQKYPTKDFEGGGKSLCTKEILKKSQITKIDDALALLMLVDGQTDFSNV